MTTDTKSLAIIPRSVNECVDLADRLAKSTMLAPEMRDKPANILAAIMAGQELGFGPMASLRTIHILKGIPKLSADAMVAAVLASGKAVYFEPGPITTTSATWVCKRLGSQREQSCTWTTEDAKRAGLVGGNHTLYPRQMLSSRAKSELARMVFPDVLAGVYTEDEIPNGTEREWAAPVEQPRQSTPIRQPTAEPVEDAEIVDEAAAAIDAIKRADSADALRALAKSLAITKTDAAGKVRMSEAYKARLAELTAPAAPAEPQAAAS